MHKNAMKNTKTAAVMEIKCGGGGVCVCVCVCTGAFARVHTHTQAERAILYGGHLQQQDEPGDSHTEGVGQRNDRTLSLTRGI